MSVYGFVLDSVGWLSGELKCLFGRMDFSEGVSRLRQQFIEKLLGVDVSSCGFRVGFARSVVGEVVGGVRGLGYGFIVVDGWVEYRALPGVGGEAFIVNFMPLWHPVLDVPWFPGSSVKGVLRTAYRLLLEERGVGEECVEFCEELVFGSTGYRGVRAHSGLLVAFDAYPVECGFNGGLVEADVWTPHYQGGSRIETELDVEPKPIMGLSVARGTVFRFVVGFKMDVDAEKLVVGDKECLQKCFLGNHRINLKLLKALFEKALTEIGFGAKTTRGYGYFNKLRIVDYSLGTNSRSRGRAHGNTIKFWR